MSTQTTLAASTTSVLPVDKRDNLRLEVGRMILMGYGMAGIGASLDLDYDTVRKYRDEVQAGWYAEIDDPRAARASMLGWTEWLKRKAAEYMELKPSPAWHKALTSVLMAELEITGLRRHTVNVESQQFAAIIKAVVDSREEASQLAAVDGEVRLLADGSDDDTT